MIYLSIAALLVITAKSQYCTSDYNCTAIQANYTCESVPGTNISLCSDTPFPSPYCTNDTQCAWDETCEYNPIYDVSVCSNQTSPFCESNADCMQYPGSPINFTCQYYPTLFELEENNATVYRNISLPYCLPADQCQNATDCLLGSTCEPLQLPNTTFTYNACMDFNVPCMNDTDCIDGLSCWNSTFCYVGCMNDTDCGVPGYVCGMPAEGVYACAPDGAFDMPNTTYTPTTTYSDPWCTGNGDCGWERPVCYYGSCVECTNNTHCEAGYVCDWWNKCELNITITTTETPCVNNSDCWGWESICAYGECVECMQDSDCNTTWYGGGYICNNNYTCEQHCSSDDHCKDNIYSIVCDEDTGNCVECTGNDDCINDPMYGAGWTCQNGYCSDYISSFCEGEADDYCAINFRDDYTCQDGWCSNVTSPYCEGEADDYCEIEFGDDYTCQDGWCSNYVSPRCDDQSDDYCEITFGSDYECQPWGNFSYCSNYTQPSGPTTPCESSDDCAGNYYPACGESGYCVQCEETKDCENNDMYGEGWVCELNPILNMKACTDEPAPYCTTSEDCKDVDSEAFELGAGFNYSCEQITVPVNNSGTWIDITVKVCLPQDQCTLDGDDCPITGSECQNVDMDGIFSVNVCGLSNTTCTADDDCTAIDADLRCYQEEGRCYLPCETNKDCDSENTGWYCQTPGDDIWGCLPLTIDNVTRYSTDAPSADPTEAPTTEMPTTAEPTEAPEQDPNTSGASQLAIFGGMIIMVKYVLFI